MNKQEILVLIKKRITFHRKHFNRYRKEVDDVQKMEYISKRNLGQLKYSNEMSGRELYIMDELEYIEEKIKCVKVGDGVA